MIPRFGHHLSIGLVILILATVSSDKFEEDKYGVKYASECEVCKILVQELESKLEETGANPENLEMGYHLDNRQKNQKKYKTSQLRLIESMEETCEGIMRYSIHKERKDSTRFAKGQSQTFSTLHGLVAKGVKVDLGIPYELWDKPSAEITHLKTQCDDMMEKYEGEIEDWYNNHQEAATLSDYLCKDRVLEKSKDYQCLSEVDVAEIDAQAHAHAHGDGAELPKLKTEL